MTSSSVDWRNRFGWPWLTRIKDQGGCGSCYIFSAVGVLEAMLRIEHCLWSLRSEGDVGDAISLYFGAHGKCQGGSPGEVLDWAVTNGVADPGWLALRAGRAGRGADRGPSRAYREARRLRHPVGRGQHEAVDRRQWPDIGMLPVLPGIRPGLPEQRGLHLPESG
jgi:hypothetical protein